MSFLSQLKSQASAVQSQREQHIQGVEQNTQATESACKEAWRYLQELAPQLNVLLPDGPVLSLDGKTAWPAMQLVEFRADARKKKLRDREVFDYIAIGWKLQPKPGGNRSGTITVNFPPDLQRVEASLQGASVPHERQDIRHPEKNTLQAYRFEYQTEARGYVTITPNHDQGMVAFRLVTVSGFSVKDALWPAAKVTVGLMDELAKLLVQQPSRFL